MTKDQVSVLHILDLMKFNEFSHNLCRRFVWTDKEKDQIIEIIVQLRPLNIDVDICINDDYEQCECFEYSKINDFFKFINIYFE